MSKTTVTGSIVDVSLSTKPDKDGTKYDQKWKLNFDNVTPDELMLLATKHVVITIQRRFRDGSVGARDDFAKATFDVADVMAETRTREKLTPMEQARKSIRAMSPTERAEFMAEENAIDD